MTVHRCIAQHQQACFLLLSHVSLQVVLAPGGGGGGGGGGEERVCEVCRAKECSAREKGWVGGRAQTRLQCLGGIR